MAGAGLYVSQKTQKCLGKQKLGFSRGKRGSFIAFWIENPYNILRQIANLLQRTTELLYNSLFNNLIIVLAYAKHLFNRALYFVKFFFEL